MNKKILSAATLALFAAPALTLASFNPGAVPAANASLSVIQLIDLVISFIWPVIVVAIILLFTFSAFQFFTANGEAEKVGQARNAFIWGVVGTVVIFLAWSIPFIIRNTLGV